MVAQPNWKEKSKLKKIWLMRVDCSLVMVLSDMLVGEWGSVMVCVCVCEHVHVRGQVGVQEETKS